MAGRERKAEEIAANRNLAAGIVTVIAAIAGVAGAADAATSLKVILAVAVVAGALVVLVLHLLERGAASREAGLGAGTVAQSTNRSTPETRKRLKPVVRWSLIAGTCAALLLVGAVAILVSREGSNHDYDNDGFLDPPVGDDCNTRDPAINPGAADVPENGLDEDCDRADAQFPVLDPQVQITWQLVGPRTRVLELAVRPVPAGATIELRCRGGSCRTESQRLRFRRHHARVSVVDQLRRALGFLDWNPALVMAGTQIEVRMSKPRFTGLARVYRMRRGDGPSSSEYCVGPSGLRRACQP